MFSLLIRFDSSRTTVATEHQPENTMHKSLLAALLLPVGMLFNATCAGAESDPQAQSSHLPRVGHAVLAEPKLIAIRRDASELEFFAANEVRRYLYLRTGKVLPVKRGVVSGDRIVVACKDTKFCGDLGNDLGPQQFTIRTDTARGQRTWWVVGGDDAGTTSSSSPNLTPNFSANRY